MTMPQYYGPGGGFAAVAGLGQSTNASSNASAATTTTASLAPAPASASSGRGAVGTAMMVAGTAASAALAYHGYKRNNSVGWAVGWFFLGAFWPISLPVALAQGFAKPRVKSNRRRRSR